MIIVQLLGGLGNQMFQYALGRHLSIIHNCKLKLDLSFLTDKFQNPNVTPRKYELYKLNIIENFADEDDLDKFRPEEGWTGRLKEQFIPRSIIEEKQFPFDMTILKSGRNTYLKNGYWQSEKYFKSIEPVIRREFQVKTPVAESNKFIELQINNTNSVSVHVRRSDFFSNETANKLHGIDLKDYYKNAIKLISHDFPDAVFFVFSDEIEWTRSNIKADRPIYYVENNSDSNDEDMKLMSSCRHHIIANSSFSWWGAWLCQFKNKKVIAPSGWFNDKTIDTSDLYPEGWIKLN